MVHNLGLCIALWDIVKIEESFIFPGDGSSHTIGKDTCGVFLMIENYVCSIKALFSGNKCQVHQKLPSYK